MLQENLALGRSVGDRSGIANTISDLGNVALVLNDDIQAYTYNRESLAIFQELEDRAGIAECLEGIARVASAQGDSIRSIQLLGAAASLRDTSGVPLRPIERSVIDCTMVTLRAATSQEQFTAAWSAGQTMKLEQVIVYVFEHRLHG